MKHDGEETHISAVIRGGTYYGEITDETLKADIVAEHDKISAKEGSVFLGKLGRTPGADKVQLVEDAIGTRRASLIVVKKIGSEYEGYAASLSSIHVGGYTPDRNTVPKYYHHLIPEIKLWFEIGTFKPVSEEQLQKLRLISNDRGLVETLKSCRTSLIFVRNVSHL